MVFISSSSDSGSGSDSSSEAEFRPPAGLAIKAIRRRMALRSSPRKCLLSSLKSPQTSPKKCSQNSPAKHSSPSKLIQNTQNYVKSKTPLKILMKSRCSTGNQKKLNCTSPVKENSAEVNSKFVRTSKQNSSSEPIDDIPNNLNNKGSPLKLKKKLAKYCLNKCDNDKMHPHKRKIASRVSSPEFEPLKKARSAALGKKLLIDSDQMFSSFAVKDHRMAFSPKLNDYSNPFDEEGFDEEKRHLNINKLRMRDLIDLYRFLNCPDIYGFCRRPVYRPFLIRNLFYMRKQQPCDLFIDAERSVMENSYEKVILKQLRTGSRASDKIPTTVKFTLIRNYNCFGHKTAIVQCYHVTELNGRFSQLKRIPSANFEKAVNERISSYIDIDMLEECQISALEDRNSRAEHFVVRVVFRLEDAEIGGRHLRKMASRQSGESSTKLLRKNGPNDDREVVMFGSVRIFSFTPDQGLRVLTGEASILLNTATEMGLDDLNTKSSVGQVTRLIHSARNRSGRGSIPFIRIIALNEEEEEAEAEKAESERQKCDSPMRFVGSSFERRSLDRMVVGLLKMEMDVADSTASSSLLTNEEGSKNITSAKNRQQMQKGLLELPEKIVLKFISNSSESSSLTSNPLFSTLRRHPNTRSKELDTSEDCNKSRWNVPKMHFSDSSATEDQHGTENSSSDENSFIGRSPQSVGCTTDIKIQAKDSTIFALRVLSVYSPCFFCKAKLRLNNLWTLYKHFRFVHPRFIFKYESRILVTGRLSLPGFSVSLNMQFDALFELTPLQGKISRGCSSKISSIRKWSFDNRPVWLVTRELAKKVRANDEFPIERFTAIAHAHCNEFEYLLSLGRFAFDVPTKINQQWIIQSGSRKLEDITDLHPAERVMMQMWNAFLPGVHITMLARKMTYKAARVFVSYHWHQIEQLKLRTHFLLLLSTLLNISVIDEEERYDLLMRLDPDYVLYNDNRHLVTRELTLLEKEKRSNQRAGSIDDGTENFDSKDDLDIKQPKNSKKESRATLQNTFIEFNSLLELRNRYPFASGKRLGNIWKFIRPYDFKDFSLQISTAPITKS